MIPLFFAIIAGLVAVVVYAYLVVRRKNLDLILRANLTRRRQLTATAPIHIFLCFADHYEPYWRGADAVLAHARVQTWLDQYPASFDEFRDGGGRAPQHTFFYPAEEYDPVCIDILAQLTRAGHGDVEIHLHHDGDTSQGFREKIEVFKRQLHEEHGLLRHDKGVLTYGFIHGNWALDDSGVDGRWCGVRDEISILRDTGCYADFTYPSAPHPTQPPMINRIYYATDDPQQAGSHHSGTDAEYHRSPSGDLLMVTGPLAINWRRRRGGVIPAVENGDITGNNPATPARVDLWIDTAITLQEWPSWRFVKIHTHGAQEANAAALLGEPGKAMHRYLLDRYNDGERYCLHYVTAWEMFNAIAALESGDADRIARVEAFDYAPPV